MEYQKERHKIEQSISKEVPPLNLHSLADSIGTILHNTNKKEVFRYGFCSDLMSDLLTTDIPQTVLITGLITTQTIRTAHIAEIHCVIFVRNKVIDHTLIDIAKELDINIIRSEHTMFKVCGMLYKRGLKAIY
ncbi:hypothetical protein K4L44_02515 [Halosquirtibacter laminarini]|uniref:Uncharacterized protein n=1 Tax=Halosquirtibacter laminarini TaxID=3374600 RepID=A0AC61NGT4_9BACT|nr:hypothetical protein K4L44_02515 [Prolixibacteraceae bacterium]